ncbi:hypothetical protein [Mesorhizobium sp.]|uniref:hypothetical protein n=1 Tax=Mesorhizobium sp. TaxID=1871066 RepID=UPI000FE99180|nr:hypothetical protein [Mesorhizobium sp.]RWK55043.1 MAG: hypothetical protein EOR48_14565 [Mesorhizobium sp.]TIP47743.1 MAG: hypothetical protein E5X62_04840 [Mesorhizobium sp.]
MQDMSAQPATARNHGDAFRRPFLCPDDSGISGETSTTTLSTDQGTDTTTGGTNPNSAKDCAPGQQAGSAQEAAPGQQGTDAKTAALGQMKKTTEDC